MTKEQFLRGAISNLKNELSATKKELAAMKASTPQIQHDAIMEAMLDLVIEASEAEPQTLVDPGCDAEFNVTEATLDGKCAFELIDYENWSVKRQVQFNADVEAYYIETECGEE